VLTPSGEKRSAVPPLKPGGGLRARHAARLASPARCSKAQRSGTARWSTPRWFEAHRCWPRCSRVSLPPITVEERGSNILTPAAPWYDVYETKMQIRCIGAIGGQVFQRVLSKLRLLTKTPRNTTARLAEMREQFAKTSKTKRAMSGAVFEGSGCCFRGAELVGGAPPIPRAFRETAT